MTASEWYESSESSNVQRFRFDADSLTLEVQFKNGICYEYFDVPEAVYTSFCQAPSKGQFFMQNIRGAFRYARC
jgi:hypothetical protein